MLLLNGHFIEREEDPSCQLSSVFLSVVVGFMAVITCQIFKILWINKCVTECFDVLLV